MTEWLSLSFSLESPLDCKEIKSVNPKGNQSWIFIGRTDAEAETLILWPPDAKNWFTGKDPDAEKDWRQEEKGWQRMRWLDGITDSMDMSLSWWWTGRPGVLRFMGSQRVGHDWATELNWTFSKVNALRKGRSGTQSLEEIWLMFSQPKRNVKVPQSLLRVKCLAIQFFTHLLFLSTNYMSVWGKWSLYDLVSDDRR